MKNQPFIHTPEFSRLPYSVRMAYVKAAVKAWMQHSIPLELAPK